MFGSKKKQDDVRGLLAVLRSENAANERDPIGMPNRPKYVRAKAKLEAVGAAEFDELLAALAELKPGFGDNGTSSADMDLANDIAEVLGSIGDPRAIDPLVGLIPQYVPAATWALAAFPAGVQTLIELTRGDDDFLRGTGLQGLAAAKPTPPETIGATLALLDDTSESNREKAVRVAGQLKLATPEVIAKVEALAGSAENDRLRNAAENTAWQLRNG